MTNSAYKGADSDAEQLLQLAKENGDVGTWRWDGRGETFSLCERARRHLGIVQESNLSLEVFLTAIYPEDRLHLESCLRHSLGAGIETFRSVEFRTASLPKRWICCKWSLAAHDRESAPRLVGTTADVTLFRDNRDLIRRSENMLRHLGDNVPNGAIYQIVSPANQPTRFSYISLGIERLFGVSADEVLSDPNALYALVHPEDRDRVRRAEHKALATLTNYECEFRQFTRGGELRWVLCRAAPFRAPSGDVTWDGVIIDITDQKRTEERLRTSEATFRTLADTMPQIIWSSTADGKCDYFNNRWYEYSGMLPAKSLEDQFSLVEFVHPSDYQNLLTDWNACLQTGAAFHSEFRLKRNDSEYRWFIARAVPLRDASDTIVRWVGTCTDIHAGRQNREDLERAKARAEDEGRVKDEFLATLSHELRTPLNSILGWSQLMRRTTMSEEDWRKGIEIIERSARLQVGLIEDLLDMSRIIAGKLRLNVQKADVTSIVQSAVTSAHPTATEKQITIVQQIDYPGAVIKGDPGRIQQIVWNLLSNALKFTPRGGKIWITVSRLDTSIQIEVRDTGIGIADSFLPHVFERFRQADGSSTKKYDGLGLGLSIVRSLAELHGGTVIARSAGSGKGASFAVRFPHPKNEKEIGDNRDASALGAVRRMPSCRTSLTGIKVLVVDDNEDSRDILGAILEGEGAQVVSAESVDQSLDILMVQPVDVVLTDIGMPDKDGYALMREIQSWRNQRTVPPVVALTAFARSEDRTRALVAGFQHHLPKPVEPAELIAIVGNLGRRAAAA